MKFLMTMLTVLMLTVSVFATTREKVSKETGEAIDAATDYAKENKEEFTRKMHENLESVEADIADLKSRAGVAASGAREKLNSQIEVLEGKRDDMKKRLDKISSTSDRAWKKMKSGLERAWSEVKVAYSKASKELEEEENTKTSNKTGQ